MILSPNHSCVVVCTADCKSCATSKLNSGKPQLIILCMNQSWGGGEVGWENFLRLCGFSTLQHCMGRFISIFKLYIPLAFCSYAVQSFFWVRWGGRWWIISNCDLHCLACLLVAKLSHYAVLKCVFCHNYVLTVGILWDPLMLKSFSFSRWNHPMKHKGSSYQKTFWRRWTGNWKCTKIIQSHLKKTFRSMCFSLFICRGENPGNGYFTLMNEMLYTFIILIER